MRATSEQSMGTAMHEAVQSMAILAPVAEAAYRKHLLNRFCCAYDSMSQQRPSTCSLQNQAICSPKSHPTPLSSQADRTSCNYKELGSFRPLSPSSAD